MYLSQIDGYTLIVCVCGATARADLTTANALDTSRLNSAQQRAMLDIRSPWHKRYQYMEQLCVTILYVNPLLSSRLSLS